MALRCVATLAVLIGASGCAVRTVDCWQLDGAEMAQARKAGQCGDAFARNSQEIVPLSDLNRPRARKPAVRAAETAARTKPAKSKSSRPKPAVKPPIPSSGR